MHRYMTNNLQTKTYISSTRTMYAIHMYYFYRCKRTLFFLIWLLPTFAYWKVDHLFLAKAFTWSSYLRLGISRYVNVITVNHSVTDSRLSLLADLSAQRQTVSVNSILSSCITTRWQKAMLWLNDRRKKGDDLISYNQMTHYQTDILWYCCGDVML